METFVRVLGLISGDDLRRRRLKPKFPFTLNWMSLILRNNWVLKRYNLWFVSLLQYVFSSIPIILHNKHPAWHHIPPIFYICMEDIYVQWVSSYSLGSSLLQGFVPVISVSWVALDPEKMCAKLLLCSSCCGQQPCSACVVIWLPLSGFTFTRLWQQSPVIQWSETVLLCCRWLHEFSQARRHDRAVHSCPARICRLDKQFRLSKAFERHRTTRFAGYVC